LLGRSANNSKFVFRYGRYYLGINVIPEERFQDRTPRPHLSWKKYQPSTDDPILEQITNDQKWIKKYASAAINRVQTNKKSCKKSWQDDLVREIIKIAILENISLEELNQDVKKTSDDSIV